MTGANDGKTEQPPAPEGKEAAPSQPLRDAWLSVLGVFHSAESEVQKAAGRLLESFGLSPTDTSAQGIAKEVVARMKKNRDELERRVEEGVKAALHKVREPIDREVAQLRGRIEELGRKLEEKGRGRLNRDKPTDAGKSKPDKSK